MKFMYKCCRHRYVDIDYPPLTHKEGKVFQEPPSGESANTECGVNYQLLAVIY